MTPNSFNTAVVGNTGKPQAPPPLQHVKQGGRVVVRRQCEHMIVGKIRDRNRHLAPPPSAGQSAINAAAGYCDF